MRRLTLIAPLLAAGLLAGCHETEVYSGLSEREANQMLAAIQSGGLDAQKSSRDGKTWTIEAPKAEFTRVIALLEEQNYPREKFDNLGGLFRKEGFVSSPVEEHARLVYGLSQELSDTLSRIDGVVGARVHIALPQNDPLADAAKPSSVSVFIKYDPQVDLSGQLGSIRALVANSIEGLPPDRITVVLSPERLRPAQPVPWRVKDSAPLLGLAGLAGAALGWGLWRLARRPRRAVILT